MSKTYEHKMEIHATAIWNNEKGAWDVQLSSTEHNDNQNHEPVCITGYTNMEIKACDEFVIPAAILHFNGINASIMAEAIYPSIEELDRHSGWYVKM